MNVSFNFANEFGLYPFANHIVVSFLGKNIAIVIAVVADGIVRAYLYNSIFIIFNFYYYFIFYEK